MTDAPASCLKTLSEAVRPRPDQGRGGRAKRSGAAWDARGAGFGN
ncbi:MAG: hypothetical protein ACLFVN_12085 [Phycisphaeraceae bacterium]